MQEGNLNTEHLEDPEDEIPMIEIDFVIHDNRILQAVWRMKLTH